LPSFNNPEHPGGAAVDARRPAPVFFNELSESGTMSENWTEVAKVEDVPDQGTFLVEVEGEPVCLYNVEGEIYATHDTCSHGSASLSEGFIVEDGLIECPLHQGTFDVRTGKAVGIPCKDDIRSYAVKVEGGAVYIKA
jgi:nitrite reductase/ring-hydroxylating ferredoxin subunit